MGKNSYGTSKTATLPTIDLHGERLDGLVDKVDRFITLNQGKGHNQIRIMTGKGSGQVRAAVQSYLKLGGYPSHFERLPNGATNDGVLVVQI